MTTQEIKQEIEEIKESLENPSLPESAKNAYRRRKEALESQLAGASEKEDKEEKKEEKKLEEQVKKEEETQEDLEKTIKKAEAVIGSKSMPDSAKEKHKAKLKEAKDKLTKIKKEAGEEKKEVKKKAVRKAPPKERVKKIKEAKKKSEVREKKIKRVMTELEKLVENSKKLKKRYSGHRVDLEKDAVRRAKPFGYRYKGKHNYRVVQLEGKRLKNAIKEGRVYKETRPTKADSTYRKASKKTYPMLEEGGMMKDGGEMAKGGLFKDRYNRNTRYGRSWSLDHKQHNKKEDYEVPTDKRKS